MSSLPGLLPPAPTDKPGHETRSEPTDSMPRPDPEPRAVTEEGKRPRTSDVFGDDEAENRAGADADSAHQRFERLAQMHAARNAGALAFLLGTAGVGLPLLFVGTPIGIAVGMPGPAMLTAPFLLFVGSLVAHLMRKARLDTLDGRSASWAVMAYATLFGAYVALVTALGFVEVA